MADGIHPHAPALAPGLTGRRDLLVGEHNIAPMLPS